MKFSLNICIINEFFGLVYFYKVYLVENVFEFYGFWGNWYWLYYDGMNNLSLKFNLIVLLIKSCNWIKFFMCLLKKLEKCVLLLLL